MIGTDCTRLENQRPRKLRSIPACLASTETLRLTGEIQRALVETLTTIFSVLSSLNKMKDLGGEKRTRCHEFVAHLLPSLDYLSDALRAKSSD